MRAFGLGLLAGLGLQAQEVRPVSYDQKMDVVYGEVHGTGLLMDVFTPNGKPNGLGIIDVVSGAYRSDRGKIRDHMLAQVYPIFCSRGYTVFAIRPGSSTRYTCLEMDEHVKTGIRYVKAHASEYKIDPERLGLTGASAGGHLATLAALTPQEGNPDARNPLQRLNTRVKAAAVFFPPTDLLDWNGKPASFEGLGNLLFLGGSKGHSEDEIKERAREISPARLVKGPAIPFLFIHGDADPLVPLQQSQKMVEALKAEGGSAELIVKKGGGHPWLTIFEEVKVMADWFDRHLQKDQPERSSTPTGMQSISIGKDGRHFAFSNSDEEFRPWGFNYDHDAANRLLEDYWQDEWTAVEGDFEEMKALGANTVRIHLQVAKFMKSAQETNPDSLQQLARLLTLAEKTRLYLDITGLGCYKKEDVPQWYNELGEQARWDVQTRFWEAAAQRCRQSPAVFCYDLMNEPVVTEDKTGRDWTPGAFGDRYFVQRLTLDFAGRTPKQIAKAWVDKMAGAIRKHDSQHLLTVGAIPWALTWPTAKPLFYSKEVSQNLDFVSVHFYPKKGEVDKALTALAVYDIGKPMVVEEMFPLNCSVAELDQFIEKSKSIANGWISFYWGKTIAEYRQQKGSIADAMMLDWLEYVARKAPGPG